MKNIILLFAFQLAIGSLIAQKISVKESKEKVGDGSNNALVVSIYEADASDIEKEWKSLMKKYDAKVSTKDGVFADNAMISSLGGNNPIDVYAKVEKVKDGENKLIVAFDLGGAYLSSSQHSSQFKEAKNMVSDFAIKVTKEAIAGQLKVAEKVLNKLEDNHKDLVDDQKDLEKNIEEYKAKIKKAEEDIIQSKNDQEKKKQEIEAQKKIVEAIQQKEKAVN